MANKRLNAVITIGGAVAGSLGAAFGQITKSTTKLGQAVDQLTRRQKLLSDSIKTFGRQGKDVDGLREKYSRVTRELERQRALLQRVTVLENARQANMARRAELRGQMLDVVAIGAAIMAPGRQAIKFENAMLGVAKQVEGARDKSGQLTPVYHEMAKAIKQLGREVPMATTSLAEMVTAGARMGVARDQLIEFTRASAMMAEAFEQDPGELAEQMGKIAGLYKIPIPAIGQLADTINWLDDNAISKGGDIIDFLTRTGGVAGAVKITGTEMAALGSTLLTLGERTETAGTATNALIQKLAAADKGTKKFKMAMAELGLTTESVQAGMQKDAQGTILRVLDAVNKLPEENRLGVLVELVGLEHSDTVAKLAGNLEEYRRQITLAHSEEAKGSMTREFQARLQTTDAQLKLASNRVSELATNIGSVLLPGINAVLGPVGQVITYVAELAQEFPRVTAAIVGTVVGLSTLKVASLAGAYALTFLKGAGLQAMLMATRLAPAIRLVGTALMWSGKALLWVGRALLLNPIGLAVTAIAGAVFLIYTYWGPLKDWFGNLWEGIKSTFAGVYDWIVGKAVYLMELPGRIKAKVAGVFGGGATDQGPMQYDAMGNPTGVTALPDIPKPATRGGTTIMDSSQHTYQITQQPGQDPKALAQEIERLRRHQDGVRARSSLVDGVGAQ